MPSAKITSKGQITLPLEVRKALKLRPGDRVSFRTARDGRIVLEPDSVDLMSLKGAIKAKTKGVTLDDMERAIARGHRGK